MSIKKFFLTDEESQQNIHLSMAVNSLIKVTSTVGQN